MPDRESNPYIDALRAQPIESLSPAERAQLLSWFKAAGLDAEYHRYEDAIRGLEARALIEPRNSLIEPKASEGLTTQGVVTQFESMSFDSEHETHDTDTGPMSTEELLLPDPRAVTLQPLIQLPPTERHRLEDTMKLKLDETDSGSGTSDGDPHEDLVESTGDVVIDRGVTDAIRRPKAKPRLIDRTDRPEQPPPMPRARQIRPKPASSPVPKHVSEDYKKTQDGSFSPDHDLASRVETLALRQTPTSSSVPTVSEETSKPEGSSHRSKTFLKGGRRGTQARRTWLWLGLIGVVAVGVSLIGEYQRASSDLHKQRQMLEKTFRAGNYLVLSEAIDNMVNPVSGTRIRRVVLNGILPVIGMPTVDDRNRTLRLDHELKYRSTLGYLFQDDERFQSVPRLVEQANRLNLEASVAAAQILMSLSKDRMDRIPPLLRILSAQEANAHWEWVRAQVYLHQGEEESAETALRSAVSLDFDHPYAALSLASLLRKRGDKMGALKLIDQVLMTRPDFVLARIDSASVGLAIPERRKYAKQELSKLSEEKGISSVERSMAALLLGKDAMRLTRYREADDLITRALSNAIQPDDAISELVHLYLIQGRGADAQALLKRTPGVSLRVVRTLWARVYLRSGQPERALAELQLVASDGDTRRDLEDSAHALLLLASTPTQGGVASKNKKARARARLSTAGGIRKMTTAQLLLYGLLNPNDSQVLAVARRRAREDGGAVDTRFIQWSTVVAELRMRQADYERAYRGLMASSKGKDGSALVSWIGCRIEIARLRVKSAVGHCERALKRGQFRPARQRLAKIHELRGEPKKVVSLLSSWPEEQLADTDDQFRLLRALYHTDKGPILASMGQSFARQNLKDLSGFATGLSEVLSHRQEDGLARLRRVGGVRNNDARTLVLLGDVFRKASRPRESQTYYEKAINLDQEPFARLGLARLFLEHGQPDLAMEQAKDALATTKKSLSPPTVRAAALSIQARVLISKGARGNMRKADRLLAKAIRVKAGSPDALIAQGILKEKMGKKAEAKAIYRDLISRSTRAEEAHYRLGRLLMSNRLTRREGVALLRILVDTEGHSRWKARALRLLPAQRR